MAGFKLIEGEGPLEETLACFQMLAAQMKLPFRRDSIEKVLRDSLRRRSNTKHSALRTVGCKPRPARCECQGACRNGNTFAGSLHDPVERGFALAVAAMTKA